MTVTTSASTRRRTRARILLVSLVAVLLGSLTSAPASACSCAMQDPGEALRGAEAAFVGTLVDQTDDRWTFDVEAVLAGDLPSPLTFEARADDGASCGLTVDVGARYGLVMYREGDGRLTSNLCLQHDPDVLLAAGEPREPSPAASRDPADGQPASSASGGWALIGATVAGAVLVLGGAAAWARRSS